MEPSVYQLILDVIISETLDSANDATVREEPIFKGRTHGLDTNEAVLISIF